MNTGVTLADRAQAALEAWMHALSLWNDALPRSSLISPAQDRWTRHSEVVDVLYRRWREIAREVATQVERRRAAETGILAERTPADLPA